MASAIEIGHGPPGFAAYQHPGSGIGNPQGTPQVNECIEPPGPNIAEFQRGSPQEAPAPDLLAQLHDTGGIKLPPIDTDCTFIQ